MEETALGVNTSVVLLLLPNCPLSDLPHVKTFPSSLRAITCAIPVHILVYEHVCIWYLRVKKYPMALINGVQQITYYFIIL
jgi:hypothetical protein